MITFAQLAEWIIKHRKGRTFKNYPMAKICEELVVCAQNNTLWCVTDENNDVVGVATGRVNGVKEFYVSNVLVTHQWALKRMLQDFVIRFPTYNIVGLRKHGVIKQFNAENLINKL